MGETTKQIIISKQHLLDETELYIKGKRAQGNLFESDTE